MYKSIITTVVITVIGIVIFDNVGVSAAIGIGVGSLFILFSDNGSTKEECGEDGGK